VETAVDERQTRLARIVRDMSRGSARRQQAAFARFYDEVATNVYSHALAVLRDAQAAEEVAQEALLVCWKRRASYDSSRGSVVAWTMTIARSRTLDRLREISRRQAAERASREQAMHDVQTWHEDESALSPDVKDMLVKLPERERRIVYMAYFAQLTHHEISQQLEIPEGTVKSALYGALRMLRRQMEDPDGA
jgi:RNA polymerase sigma-70 factor (ECF subfamily)